jgi:hypothetical protein
MAQQTILQLDAVARTITYNNVTKVVPDGYYNDEIAPMLYPTWDSDRDKLVYFVWYSNDTYMCQRRKYRKDHKTGEYFWKDYEFTMLEVDRIAEGKAVYQKLKETFFLIESLENIQYDNEFAKIRAMTTQVNWLTVRLARNFLLAETDYVFIEDSPVSDEEKALYRLYRQKLRDIPVSVPTGEAGDVKFPISPNYYKKIWLEKDPNIGYLDSADQFVPLASHYLATFTEKFSSYLIVRNLSEGVYINTFMDALKESGAVWDEITPISTASKQEAEAYLRNLLQMIEADTNE